MRFGRAAKKGLKAYVSWKALTSVASASSVLAIGYGLFRYFRAPTQTHA